MNLNPGYIWKRGWAVLVLCMLALGSASARAGDFKFEAQLVWATDDEKSPDNKHKPVDEETRKVFENLPLKWKHFFEVKRETSTVSKGGSKKMAMSERCSIEIRHIEGQKFEVTLFGSKDKVCSKQTQTLEKGKSLVVGGNAPNKTAWLVVLKRIE
ncbi:MAG: hypothetical protein HOP33_07980 [Verrucomicrobia bacterium]|nr:hypothetical protein [Verrucomicrobiota bacterium]